MKRNYTRKMLVEADEDKRVIPQLVEANGVPWGETAAEAIVFIEAFGGVTSLLLPDVIETELKQSGLRAIGIVVDADDDAQRRWQQIRIHCLGAFPGTPVDLPEEGLVVTNEDGLRLGVWIMPDNRSRGMLETFLSFLVPPKDDRLLEFTRTVRGESRQHGASWKDAHADKVLIHSWLALQDPPGRQLHTAILEHKFEPNSDRAMAFVSWFRNLYEV